MRIRLERLRSLFRWPDSGRKRHSTQESDHARIATPKNAIDAYIDVILQMNGSNIQLLQERRECVGAASHEFGVLGHKVLRTCDLVDQLERADSLLGQQGFQRKLAGDHLLLRHGRFAASQNSHNFA